MKLTVISPPATLWDTKSDTAYPALQALGYSVYGLSTDPTVQADWIYVVFANGVKQVIDIPVGYEWVKDVPPNAGFSNTGNTLKQPSGDAGLFALSQAYSLGWYGADLDSPLEVDWDTLKAYKAYPQYIFERTDNAISRLNWNKEQDVFSTVPFKRTAIQPTALKDGYFFKDQSGNTFKRTLNIMCVGDSRTKGETCTPTITYPELLRDLFEADGYTVNMHNLGANGQVSGYFINGYSTLVKPSIDNDSINIIFWFCAVNGLAQAVTTPLQEYNNTKEFIGLAKADGCYTVVLGDTPYSNVAVNNLMNDYIDMLIADNSFTDAFFQLQSIPEYSDPLNTNYFCDGLHISDFSLFSLGIFNYTTSLIDAIAIDTPDVQLLKQKCLKFNGVDTKINTAIRPTNNSVLKARLKFNGIGGTQTFGCYDGVRGFAFGQGGGDGSSLLLYLGTTIGKVLLHGNDNLWHDYELSAVGLKVDGILLIEPNTPNEIFTVNKDFAIGRFADVGVIHSSMDLAYLEIDGVVIHATMGQGTNIINETDGSLLSITGTVDWTANSDYKTPPYELLLGATLFKNDSDSSVMAVCYNDGIPSVSTLTGFTKLGDYPANSGILKGLYNTYLGVKNNELVEQNFATLRALNIVPKEYFQIDNSGDCIKNMASNPFADVGPQPGASELLDADELQLYDADLKHLLTPIN